MKKGENKQYDFDKSRADIRTYLVEREDFSTSLKKLFVLYNVMLVAGEKQLFRLWYIFYNSAYCYRELGMYDKALQLLEESIEYTYKNEDDDNYLKSMWMTAEVYKLMDQKNNAKHLYNCLITSYRINNNNIDRIFNMLNVCELDCNIRRVYCLTQRLMREIQEKGIEHSNVYKKKMIKQIKVIVEKAQKLEKYKENDFYYLKIINILMEYELQQKGKNLLELKNQ